MTLSRSQTLISFIRFKCSIKVSVLSTLELWFMCAKSLGSIFYFVNYCLSFGLFYFLPWCLSSTYEFCIYFVSLFTVPLQVNNYIFISFGRLGSRKVYVVHLCQWLCCEVDSRSWLSAFNHYWHCLTVFMLKIDRSINWQRYG